MFRQFTNLHIDPIKVSKVPYVKSSKSVPTPVPNTSITPLSRETERVERPGVE